MSTPTGLEAIETLRIGDLVVSRSDKTGETAAKPIVAITPAHERRIWTVTVSYKGKDGTWKDELYETTNDHPWRTADGQWVKSASLKQGQTLSRNDGTAVVAAVADTRSAKITFNLEIEGFQTYFVGNSEIWVHNAYYKIRIPGITGKEAAKNAPSWVQGQAPYIGESGKDFASRLLIEKYGPGNFPTVLGSEFNQINQFGDRGFR